MGFEVWRYKKNDFRNLGGGVSGAAMCCGSELPLVIIETPPSESGCVTPGPINHQQDLQPQRSYYRNNNTFREINRLLLTRRAVVHTGFEGAFQVVLPFDCAFLRSCTVIIVLGTICINRLCPGAIPSDPTAH